MGGLPDPDWYLDNVLIHAEPGVGGRTVVGEAESWQAWWRSQHRAARTRWPEVVGVAEHQAFLVTTAQLRRIGVPRHRERALVRSRAWSRPVPGAICVVGGALDTGPVWSATRRRHAIQAAAAAATNEGHAVAGRSAAVVHGLPVHRAPQRVELASASRASSRHRARVARLGPEDVTTWWGVPVCTVTRTVVDLARLNRLDGLMAADAALRQGLVDRDTLWRQVERAGRWPGVVSAREVVSLASPLSESPLESAVRLALVDCGLPLPDLQVEIRVPGRRRPYRVDMLWPQQRLVLEADGRAKYTDDELWREKRRESELRAAGYRVERVIWADLTDRWPRFAAGLRAALAQ